MNNSMEQSARRLFQTALETNRCGELLDCLFDGGSATVDSSGKLVLVPAASLLQMLRKRKS